MRINSFVAAATGLSRRSADQAITANRIKVNGRSATLGQTVNPDDTVTLDGHALKPPAAATTILFNKPPGYVCSRQGQGNRTIYELLPGKFRSLKPVGRLDKNSSGLLLLTDDGRLANRLTHPRYDKAKIYDIVLGKPLKPADKAAIGRGVQLDDGPSRLGLLPLDDTGKAWQVTMTEGRNRQIRRTFKARGYVVVKLHRKQFGDYQLGSSLAEGDWLIPATASGHPAES